MARYDLRLSQEEFCQLTMRQFRWLLHRCELDWQREDYRAGVMTSMQYNLWRGKDSGPMEPADFFASLPRWEKRQPKIASDAENKAVVQMIIAQRKAAEMRKKQA